MFGVLAEYALILKIIQTEKRRDAKVSIEDVKKGSCARRFGLGKKYT